MNDGLWIGLEVTNTPASHLRSAARDVDYLHRAFDVIPEVDATSALCEFSRMRREDQLYNSHEAFINEIAMYAELGRARPRWGADKHEWLRWQQWAGAIAMRLSQLNQALTTPNGGKREYTIRSQ